HPVFRKPLKESLKRASVRISTANADDGLYVWGYILVVAEGVNGSAKRMRDIQTASEKPPRVLGKDLGWMNDHYTTHDVASVFRHYLTQLPEPVIPHHMCHD
ncbi:hypothetical protein EDD15DRAFT_2115777, partial [Pisolithus albus]